MIMLKINEINPAASDLYFYYLFILKPGIIPFESIFSIAVLTHLMMPMSSPFQEKIKLKEKTDKNK